MAAGASSRAVSRRDVIVLVLAAVCMAAALASFFRFQYINARNAAWLGVANDVEETIGRLERIGRESAQGIEPDIRALADLPYEMEEWLRILRQGDPVTGAPPLPESLQGDVDGLELVWQQTQPLVETIVANQVPYRRATSNVVTIQQTADRIAERLRRLTDRLSQRGDTQSAFLAATQLARLESLRDHARDLIGVGTDPAAESEAMTRLARDLQTMHAALLASGLDAESAAIAREIGRDLEPLGEAVEQIAADRDELVAFQRAATGLLAKVTAVTTAWATLDQGILDLARRTAQSPLPSYVLGALAVALLLVFIVLFLANARRQVREAQERDAAQQRAILELLDDITNLADGDLTVQANVTEDFTGAIADSINYTISSMRELVGTIDATAGEVDRAATQTRRAAERMAEESGRQASAITQAAQAMQQMSASMQDMAQRAEQIAGAAQQSVDVASEGARTVNRTIETMTALREQIQDTAKRIKRLGESSQEIGNIIEFINDIAEQTNTLALNASIQAAMAGEAGRGFAVVADEVQRLAERAGNATRQIETLVKTIQADTSEAIVSMERSTANVVAGARSAEEAGTALQQIEQSSAELARMIHEIAVAARSQSQTAGRIAGTMQEVREIAVRTSGTAKGTAGAIGELTELSAQLRRTVAGFKLPKDSGSAAAEGSGGAEAERTLVLEDRQAAAGGN